MPILETEDQIERWVERKMDTLDRHLMAGKITQEQYDVAVQALESYCHEQYRNIRFNR